MSAQNGGPPPGREPDPNTAILVATLLLRVAKQKERGGLSRRTAVLAAATELGVDPALILRSAEEVQA